MLSKSVLALGATSLLGSMMDAPPVGAWGGFRQRRNSIDAGVMRKDGDGKRKRVARNTRYNPNKRAHNIRGERLVINHRK